MPDTDLKKDTTTLEKQDIEEGTGNGANNQDVPYTIYNKKQKIFIIFTFVKKKSWLSIALRRLKIEEFFICFII